MAETKVFGSVIDYNRNILYKQTTGNLWIDWKVKCNYNDMPFNIEIK